jgi:hypothetical protein
VLLQSGKVEGESMETAPAIFALIAVWISGIWTDFFTWLDKPASNGIIVLGGLCLFMPIRSLEKTERRYEAKDCKHRQAVHSVM